MSPGIRWAKRVQMALLLLLMGPAVARAGDAAAAGAPTGLLDYRLNMGDVSHAGLLGLPEGVVVGVLAALMAIPLITGWIAHGHELRRTLSTPPVRWESLAQEIETLAALAQRPDRVVSRDAFDELAQLARAIRHELHALPQPVSEQSARMLGAHLRAIEDAFTAATFHSNASTANLAFDYLTELFHHHHRVIRFLTEAVADPLRPASARQQALEMLSELARSVIPVAARARFAPREAFVGLAHVWRQWTDADWREGPWRLLVPIRLKNKVREVLSNLDERYRKLSDRLLRNRYAVSVWLIGSATLLAAWLTAPPAAFARPLPYPGGGLVTAQELVTERLREAMPYFERGEELRREGRQSQAEWANLKGLLLKCARDVLRTLEQVHDNGEPLTAEEKREAALQLLERSWRGEVEVGGKRILVPIRLAGPAVKEALEEMKRWIPTEGQAQQNAAFLIVSWILWEQADQIVVEGVDDALQAPPPPGKEQPPAPAPMPTPRLPDPGHLLFAARRETGREGSGGTTEDVALRAQANLFERDLLQRRSAAKASSIENLQAGEPSASVVVGGDAFSQMFSRHRALAEADVERVGLGVIGNAHQKPPSSVVHIDRDDDKLLGFLNEDRSYLLRLVAFAVPRLAVAKVLATFQPIQFRRPPLNRPDRLGDFFRRRAPVTQLLLRVLAQADGFVDVFHAKTLSHGDREVKTADDRHQLRFLKWLRRVWDQVPLLVAVIAAGALAVNGKLGTFLIFLGALAMAAQENRGRFSIFLQGLMEKMRNVPNFSTQLLQQLERQYATLTRHWGGSRVDTGAAHRATTAQDAFRGTQVVDDLPRTDPGSHNPAQFAYIVRVYMWPEDVVSMQHLLDAGAEVVQFSLITQEDRRTYALEDDAGVIFEVPSEAILAAFPYDLESGNVPISLSRVEELIAKAPHPGVERLSELIPRAANYSEMTELLIRLDRGVRMAGVFVNSDECSDETIALWRRFAKTNDLPFVDIGSRSTTPDQSPSRGMPVSAFFGPLLLGGGWSLFSWADIAGLLGWWARETYERPTARESRASSSPWMADVTRPSRRRISERLRQTSLASLTVDGVFSPVVAKSGWVEGSTRSVGAGVSVTTEEINARRTSASTRLTTTAGLTLEPVRSVKGNDTRTISPRASEALTPVVRRQGSSDLRPGRRGTGSWDSWTPRSPERGWTVFRRGSLSRGVDAPAATVVSAASSDRAQRQLRWRGTWASWLLAPTLRVYAALHDTVKRTGLRLQRVWEHLPLVVGVVAAGALAVNGKLGTFLIFSAAGALAMAARQTVGRFSISEQARLPWVVRLWLWLYPRWVDRFVYLEGREYLPLPGQQAVVAGNHISTADAWLMTSALMRREGRHPIFIASPRRRIVQWLIRHQLAIPQQQDGTTQAMTDFLRRPGSLLGVFPGPREVVPDVEKWRTGVAWAAAAVGAPIVPFALSGSLPSDWSPVDVVWSLLKWLARRSHSPPFALTVTFGPPIQTAGRAVPDIMADLRHAVTRLLAGQSINGTSIHAGTPRVGTPMHAALAPFLFAHGLNIGDVSPFSSPMFLLLMLGLGLAVLAIQGGGSSGWWSWLSGWFGGGAVAARPGIDRPLQMVELEERIDYLRHVSLRGWLGPIYPHLLALEQRRNPSAERIEFFRVNLQDRDELFDLGQLTSKQLDPEQIVALLLIRRYPQATTPSETWFVTQLLVTQVRDLQFLGDTIGTSAVTKRRTRTLEHVPTLVNVRQFISPRGILLSEATLSPGNPHKLVDGTPDPEWILQGRGWDRWLWDNRIDLLMHAGFGGMPVGVMQLNQRTLRWFAQLPQADIVWKLWPRKGAAADVPWWHRGRRLTEGSGFDWPWAKAGWGGVNWEAVWHRLGLILDEDHNTIQAMRRPEIGYEEPAIGEFMEELFKVRRQTNEAYHAFLEEESRTPGQGLTDADLTYFLFGIERFAEGHPEPKLSGMEELLGADPFLFISARLPQQPQPPSWLQRLGLDAVVDRVKAISGAFRSSQLTKNDI